MAIGIRYQLTINEIKLINALLIFFDTFIDRFEA